MKKLTVTVGCVAFIASAASTPAWPSEVLRSTPTAIRMPLPEGATPATVWRLPNLMPALTGVPPRPGQALLQLDVYRVLGSVSGEMSRTDYLWAGIPGGEPKEGPFSFFNLASLTLAGVKFVADDSGWTWDGKERPPSGKGVEMISSPKVIVLLGESFEIAIGSQQPIEYFEKRPDGLFELKRLHEETGLTISSHVSKGESGRIVLRDLTILLRSIEAREPVEGVSLDVGRPKVKARQYKVTIAVNQGRPCGIMLGTDGYGFLLVRLRVNLVTPDADSEDTLNREKGSAITL
jgi:hypothetical protein